MIIGLSVLLLVDVRFSYTTFVTERYFSSLDCPPASTLTAALAWNTCHSYLEPDDFRLFYQRDFRLFTPKNIRTSFGQSQKTSDG